MQIKTVLSMGLSALLILCYSTGLVHATEQSVLSVDPEKGPQLFRHIVGWTLEKSKTIMSAKVWITPESIAKTLRDALTLPAPSNRDSAAALRKVTEILRSRDPDRSLRWPDVFAALVRMPHSAKATKRLFDYSLFAQEEVSLTVKKASSPNDNRIWGN
jgi:hypothetical protein